MIYKNKNFTFQNPTLADGDVIDGGNLSQKMAGTVVDFGGAVVTVQGEGNRINCDFANNVTYDGQGNNAQLSYCYWENPEMGLPVEPENCPHVYDTDTIEIDGSVVETIYHRHPVIGVV